MADHGQGKALDLVGDWSKWLIGVNLGATAGCVSVLQGGVAGRPRFFLLLAIGAFTLSLLTAALLLGLLPALAQRLPVEGEAGRPGSVYDGHLWGLLTLRLLAVLQFILFLLAAASFLGWVLTKPGP